MTGKRPTGRKVTEARKRWAAMLPLPCLRCGQPIYPGQAWDLDHPVPLAEGGDPTVSVPSHSRCNRAHGGRLKARRRGTGGRHETW